MKDYLRLLKFVAPYWPILIVSALSILVYAASQSTFAFLVGPAIKILFDPSSGGNGFLPGGYFTIPSEKLSTYVPILIITVAVVKGVAAYLNSFCLGYVAQKMIQDIRDSLFRHVLRLPYRYFTDNTTGAISARVTSDVAMIQKLMTDTLILSAKHIFTILSLVGIIFYLDWKLALIATIVFPLVIYPALRLGKMMRRATRKGQTSIGEMMAVLHEAFSGIKIIKAFGSQKYEEDKFNTTNVEYTKHNIRTARIRAVNTPLMEVLGAASIAMAIWYAHFRITNGTLAAENVISFFAAAMMLYQPVRALNGINLNIQQSMTAASRVFELMDVDAEKSSGTKNLGNFSSSVEFRDVTFGYIEGKNVIENMNISVKAGEKVAIVGSSGSGKSTLINLIPRFYECTSGTILIDGIDIREFTLESLRANIAVISQDVILFNDTVRNNIAYGLSETASSEAIESAAEAANAAKFISNLSGGYDTMIGERGIKLSGGEKQRLSIARAILKNAPILIMDEATSSLDTESEHAVQKGLDNLMKGRTAFVIAHRLSTVQNADRILVLKDGKIVESGRHAELLSRSGEYARLYSMQFRDSEKDSA